MKSLMYANPFFILASSVVFTQGSLHAVAVQESKPIFQGKIAEVLGE